MKRSSVFSLMVVLIAGCENGATNPELPSTVAVRSIQNLTSAVGAGLLLATTNQGELADLAPALALVIWRMAGCRYTHRLASSGGSNPVTVQHQAFLELTLKQDLPSTLFALA